MLRRRQFGVFAPFDVREFRLLWPADLSTSWALEMELLVLGWYILVETGSVLMLSIFGSVVFTGTLVAPLFGVASDRFGHRNVLCAMRITYTALAASLTVAIFTDLISPVFVLAIAAFTGIVRASDIGVRSALVAAIMPAPQLAGALSISRTTSDSARVFGALTGAGLAETFGMGPTYLVITTLYVCGFLLTYAISPSVGEDVGAAGVGSADARKPVTAGSPFRALADGMAYVWRNRHLQAAMWVALLVNLTAFPITNGLMPYVAKEVFQADQSGLGYLLASFSLGALIGSLLLSRFSRVIQPGRMMLVFSIGWHAMLLAFANTGDQVSAMAILVFAGLSQSFCLVPLAVLLMRTSDGAYRGRVMGARMLAIYGLPIGLMVSGVLIERIGYSVTISAYAVFGITATALIAAMWYRDLWPGDSIGNAR